MRIDRTDDGVERVATLDIETTHYDPTEGEVVAVGLGVHDRGAPATDVEYDLLYREAADDEAALVRATLETLAEYDADRLVTYKGTSFDVPFLQRRLTAREPDAAFRLPPLEHLDLYPDRKARADAAGTKWPSLEECIEAYGATPAETHWEGEALTNTRFGRELGPAYLDAVAGGDAATAAELREVVDHYLLTDLEGNLLVYYGDIGVAFEPALVGQHARF